MARLEWNGAGALALVLAGAGASACGSVDNKPPPSLTAAAGSGDGTGAGSVTISGGGGNDGLGTGGGVPSHCQLDPDGMSDDTVGMGMDDAFKFDVGGPDGADFPVSCAEVVDTLSNLGCEFWAVDLPNDYRGTEMSPPAADQQFAVVVANASALSAAIVEIYVGDGEVMPVDTADIPPGGVHQFLLDPLNIDPRETSTDGRAYRIVSDVPITAYQFNPLDNTVPVYSNDASLLLPSHALGGDYTAITGDAILLGMSLDDPTPVNSGAFISIVAIENGTDIDVMPTAPIVGGPTSATMDRGQVFTLISDGTTSDGNLSGSRVVASGPVAVFGGNMATAVPRDTEVCCADHLEHQLPPLEAWGTAYAVAPPASPSGEVSDPAEYRITAATADTELFYCPSRPDGAPDLLDAGDTVTFTTDMPFTVSSAPDKPFAVTQFLLSFQAIAPDRPGDPAMIVIPSLGQLQKKYVFVVPDGYGWNFVTIVSRGEGEVELDGDPIPDDDFIELGVGRGAMHRFVHRGVSVGAHTIEAESTVGITVVGYDDAVSYGYPGGAGLRVIAIPPVAG